MGLRLTLPAAGNYITSEETQMRNTMWVSLVTLFLLCLAGSAAQAQDSRLQVFGGYSFATHSCFGTCVLDEVKDPGLHGYTAAFVYNFNSHLGLEANFSGHNGTPTIEHDYPTPFGTGEIDKQNQNLYIYTFGPRLSIDVGDFSLFAHFLVGGTHVERKRPAAVHSGNWRGRGRSAGPQPT